jgi:hypothetical protein
MILFSYRPQTTHEKEVQRYMKILTEDMEKIITGRPYNIVVVLSYGLTLYSNGIWRRRRRRHQIRPVQQVENRRGSSRCSVSDRRRVTAMDNTIKFWGAWPSNTIQSNQTGMRKCWADFEPYRSAICQIERGDWKVKGRMQIMSGHTRVETGARDATPSGF